MTSAQNKISRHGPMGVHKNPVWWRKASGFTLIELMIVVAIIAILAMIAYPSYRQYVLRSHRVEAKSLLLDAAVRQERLYTTTSPNSYATAMSALGYASDSPLTSNGHYKITIKASPGGCSDGGTKPCTSFILKASPQGGQAQDDCSTLTLNARGQRGVEGASGMTAKECW